VVNDVTTKRNRPDGNGAAPNTARQADSRESSARNGIPITGHRVASREVSATAVYLHIAPFLVEVGDWPACGTPAWTALPADSPAKTASLFYAALQWALAEDIRQDAEREASRAISASADWSGLADQIRARRAVYIPRERAS
jgi:Protein of unknown function (DUF2742)